MTRQDKELITLDMKVAKLMVMRIFIEYNKLDIDSIRELCTSILPHQCISCGEFDAIVRQTALDAAAHCASIKAEYN